MDTAGRQQGALKASFSWLSIFEITAMLSISDPVAAMVSTVKMGRACSGAALPAGKSQGSPS